MTGVLESLSKTVFSEECSVCGDVADGYHYGVLSCRGCNAFFRRAITYGLFFSCRKGGNCLVDKSARCACRACRLKKCEEVGMDSRAVQLKRHNSGPRKKATSESSIGSIFSEFVKSRAESSPFDDFFMSMPSTSQHCGDKDQYLQISPSTLTDATGSTLSLIARLVEDYKQQKGRRYSLLCKRVEDVLNEERMSKLGFPASGNDYCEIFKVQVVLMFEWVNQLEEFLNIENPSDKAKLLRAFALRYILLDNVFYTVELGIHDKFVLVNNSYITPGVLPNFIATENNDYRFIDSIMYGESSFHLVEELTDPMINMQLTAGEMMALRLIIFWNPGSVDLSPETSSIVQAASDRAIRELHLYYEEENIEAIDTRLGNVLLLLPSLAKHTQHLFEIVKLIPSFGVMNEWDVFMKDILNV